MGTTGVFAQVGMPKLCKLVIPAKFILEAQI